MARRKPGKPKLPKNPSPGAARKDAMRKAAKLAKGKRY